ncbi:Protein phosphatase 1, regulatory subunit, and related proteins [Plasmopara halstedii]|uniref:Dynein regulatory complex subunit 3 n=1 Tax=Plasmopara halstedii TaxID=4781 RepID=A0A0P1AAW8_PLAHL|nr:Protein phosphatase 1, regulatory subunit, and related proteins [Plasmopara halstedii]CEG37412.1 Protein phosphatase 1, regulatory subunit, and related proteins [Plasmopara halstedii]|eukprot:XP_024573781.1 Protein phosphatase 1, regulatory subunit, and related proteins [Plasmopara halstedii]
MYRLGVRHAEVAVISDELIKKTLSLSFQSIFRMENLETLRYLVRLQLDNNVLEEIDAIKGLENLVELTDLSLYNNNISKLENLDTLKKLQVLSIGNNLLQSTEGLLHLKCLEKLRVLNLSGNPVCTDPEYRLFILAHLEKLKYLDYALVNKCDTIQAREQYQDELEEAREIRAIEDAALTREAEQQKYMCMLKDANVLILETLLGDMFKEDTEISKIEALPGLRNLIDDYTEKAKVATEEVKLLLLDKHANVTKEVDTFKATYEKLQSDTQKASIRAINSHRQKAKELLKQATATQASEADRLSSKVGQQLFQEATFSSEKLHDQLMNFESDVVETAQELITALESSIDVISSEAREITTKHFRTIENMENIFFENVSQLAVTLLERMASDDGEDDEYLTDECRAILNDRDALNNAINGSHDIHIGKLLAQEDAIREQSHVQVADIIKNAEVHEWSRNRARIAEVLHLKDQHLSEINHVRDEINREDEEFY